MNGLTLYQLTDEYLRLMELAADPEADDESFNEALSALSEQLEQKAVSVAQVARNLESVAAQIKTAVAQMLERSAIAERRAEQLRRYLKEQMERSGTSRIERSPYFNLAIRQNPPRLLIEEDALIPSSYLRHVPERWEPDKRAITEALKRGDAIDGCRLEYVTRLEIK